MNRHIQDAIEMIQHNATTCIQYSERILTQSSDYFAKHQASAMKAKNEDTLKMVEALKKLI